VRRIGDCGGHDHSGHAADTPLALVHRDGRATSDGWFPLGVFAFDAGSVGAVEVGGRAAARWINIAAVRFVRLGDPG
jgi:hypothetical protein